MPSGPSEAIEFTVADPGPLVVRMQSLAQSRNGWVNLQPVPDDDDPDERRGKAGVFSWLSSKGPDLPICTWVPGEMSRKGVEPDSIGLQHAGGPKARFVLAEAGVPPPAGWRIMSDHPKRGLVVELPAGTEPSVALDWLLQAAQVLAAVTLPDRWVALVYER